MPNEEEAVRHEWTLIPTLQRLWVAGDIKLFGVVKDGNVALFTTRGEDAQSVFNDHAHGDPVEFDTDELAIAYAEGFAAAWMGRPHMLEPCPCLEGVVEDVCDHPTDIQIGVSMICDRCGKARPPTPEESLVRAAEPATSAKGGAVACLDSVEVLWPWPKPKSAYDSDGPRDGRAYQIVAGGVVMFVTPSGDVGASTGRDRYLVECKTCDEVIHPNTTGATVRCREHLTRKHELVLDERFAERHE